MQHKKCLTFKTISSDNKRRRTMPKSESLCPTKHLYEYNFCRKSAKIMRMHFHQNKMHLNTGRIPKSIKMKLADVYFLDILKIFP